MFIAYMSPGTLALHYINMNQRNKQFENLFLILNQSYQEQEKDKESSLLAT